MKTDHTARAAMTPIEHFADPIMPALTWAGAHPLNSGKGYMDAPLGQLHFRDVGPRTKLHPLLLLHQCPQSIIEFAAVQNSLAARGLRSVAVDMPGYGMSDHPDCLPTIGGLADNLLALMDGLALESVVAAGHHTGASIAASLAARHPTRVTGVILHGLPLYTQEEAEAARGRVLWDCTPRPDGSHLSQLFKWSRRGDQSELVNLTWMSVGMLLQSQDIAHWAVNRHDLAADLMRVNAPGLIISEVDDMTHGMDKRAYALCPGFTFEQISDPGNAMIVGQPDRWAAIAQSFVQNLK